jgi:nitrite reductase/ring-hydroxylating ferredoxin subunit
VSAPTTVFAALAEHRTGHALPRAFHLDSSIYERELEVIWRQSWLFAGCSAQAGEPGDFFRFDLADHSVVLVRDEQGALHALHNTCRHRGMPVCPAESGTVKRLVCPYHHWSYALDRECWHCRVGHPEYVKANFDAVPDTARFRELAESRARDHAGALATVACDEHARPGLYRFPEEGRWWSANRTPLAPGFVTESLDGSPVAPLMGDYRSYDVGTLRVRTVPNLWLHASADHAVLTRLAPAGPGAGR